MAKEPEQTKFIQRDFSGGLNTNSIIAEHELQICTNVDLSDFGKVKPNYQDTLLLSQAGITAIDVVDDYVYYLVDDQLSRIRNGITGLIGTIGKGVFTAEKWEDLHLIKASDKLYKVIDGSLSQLGVDKPATGPSLSLEARNSKQIDDMEDHTTWVVSAGDAKADDAVNFKEGTKSMKVTPAVANQIAYVTKTIATDLSRYSDGTESDDEDLISLDIYIDPLSKFTYLQIVFDINTGDFKNDMYIKTVPIIPNSFNLLNEDIPQTYVDPAGGINWDEAFRQWDDDFAPEDRSEFNKSFLGGTFTSDIITTKQTSKKISNDLGQPSWSTIRVRKSAFQRIGSDLNKDWSNIVAVKIVILANATACAVSIDDLKMIGGGKLEKEKYRLSYSYVARYNFDDGSVYEEESKLSPEIEIQGDERQNIVVSNIVDSTDSQVTHKRVYIRGGGLQLRHRAGEIAQGVTTVTTDKPEDELVAEVREDVRKNGLPPTNPDIVAIVSSKLFVSKDKTVFWSRTDIPSAFIDNENVVYPNTLRAMYEKGSNLAVLMNTQDVIYVNPGFSAVEGGYNHYSEVPQGCIAKRSGARSFHLAEEGIIHFLQLTPQIISDKIRSELAERSNRTEAIGAYLRGSYFLCFPDDSIMYEYERRHDRYIKHDTITDIAVGDDGIIYVLKSDGIYSFQTDTTKRKSFTIQSPEIVLPDDVAFSNIVIDGDFGDDAVTVEYHINGSNKTSKTFTTSGRDKKYFPISQEAGYRVSVKISRTTETTYTDTAIYGAWVQ